MKWDANFDRQPSEPDIAIFSMNLMRRAMMIGFCVFCAGRLSGWADQEIWPVPMRAEWVVDLNGSEVILRFHRAGVPGSSEKRVDQFTIHAVDGGKQHNLLCISSNATQDITFSKNWIFKIDHGVPRDLLVIVLKSSWDGEDPSIKPIFVVTDGSRAVAQATELNENPKSWLDQFKRISSVFGITALSPELSEFLLKNERESQPAAVDARR